MDTYLPEWSESNVVLAATNVAAGATQNVNIDLDDLNTDLVRVQVKVIFGGTPDGDTTMAVLHSADGGTTLDSVADSTTTFANAVSATVTQSVSLFESPYVRLAITNGDSTDNVNVTVTYAYRVGWRKYIGNANITSTKFS